MGRSFDILHLLLLLPQPGGRVDGSDGEQEADRLCNRLLKIGAIVLDSEVFFFVGKAKEDDMQVVETFWQKPITVRLQNGLEHTFHSLEDSVDFLENEWPVRFGMHHRRALDLCKAAAHRLVVPEAAREAFIAACLEANMPLVLKLSSSSKWSGSMATV